MKCKHGKEYGEYGHSGNSTDCKDCMDEWTGLPPAYHTSDPGAIPCKIEQAEADVWVALHKTADSACSAEPLLTPDGRKLYNNLTKKFAEISTLRREAPPKGEAQEITGEYVLMGGKSYRVVEVKDITEPDGFPTFSITAFSPHA